MTISRVAAGVDFSPESQRAVEHAMMLARHLGTPLTLIHAGAVPEPGPGDVWREVVRARLGEERAQLDDLRERLSGQGVEVSHVIVDDYADTGVASAARELRAQLVVIGTRGRTGFRRMLLGSVAEKTARLADASVLVARGDAPAGGYRRVVVGTDYSPLAQQAFERALELTAADGVVQVVYAWAAPLVEYDLNGAMLAGLRQAADQEAEEQRARILAVPRPPGVTVRFDLRDGTAVEVLEAESGSADLIAVGTHGRRGVRRFLLGSVAEATIRHAHCSVLVAR